jgi:hypothetical protein
VSPVTVIIVGVLALVAAASMPLVRSIGIRSAAGALSSSDSAAYSVAVWAIAEYALWEVPALLGFNAFILGATWLFFGFCLALTSIGFAISFPRPTGFERRIRGASASKPAGGVGE